MKANYNNEILNQEFQKMSLDELQQQRLHYRSRIQGIQNEISNLAFNNYRTYADVGRMAEHCKDMFMEINQFMAQVKHDYPSILEDMTKFKTSFEAINDEYNMLDEINSINCHVWEFLKLPKLMDKCIRAGKYEIAYALTNFAVNIKQSKLVQNPMIKEIVDVLIEARHGLLDELFNKFSGPIDLAKSIQVVNNIRKIPYISNTQLRVSILQYRDIYLEKNVLNIASQPDFPLRVIEIYRDCMYDTIVLYMAVFPNNADFQRKYTPASLSDDTRWERWTRTSQMYLFQSWAHRNIERLFGHLRLAEAKSALDVEAMIGKLMSFAYSFGRMGLDFRSLVLNEFTQIIVDGFRRRVADAVKNFTSLSKIDMVDSDIFESTLNELESDKTTNENVLSAPLELCVWDDLCVFGNQIIEALNELRHLLAINYINQIFGILNNACRSVFKWVDDFFPKSNAESSSVDSSTATTSDHPRPNTPSSVWTKADEAKMRRATRLLFQHFVPFLNRCFFSCFSYEKCIRPLFGGRLSLEEYNERYSILNNNLFVECKNGTFFEETLAEPLSSVINKKETSE